MRTGLWMLLFVMAAACGLPEGRTEIQDSWNPGYMELRDSGSGLWAEATHFPNGWSLLPWFGYFCELEQGWIYHLEHGYVYCIGANTTNMFLYDRGLQSWTWISSKQYPYLYKYGENEGWYRYYTGGEFGNRWYWRCKDSRDILEPDMNKPVADETPAGFSLIPVGDFMMGDVLSEGSANERPVHSVHVTEFYMQQTEATYAEVMEVLNWAIGEGLAGGEAGLVANLEGEVQAILFLHDNDHMAWDGSKLILTDECDDCPCSMITWYGAMAYCYYRTLMEGGLSQAVNPENWTLDLTATGYRLPTEAEWEKAARGGQAEWRYSFGMEISHELASWGSFNDGYAEVGSYPATGYGLYDMTGNMLEWCYDWYSDDYYASSPGLNPMGPDSGDFRCYRTGGGSAYYCRISSRSGSAPGNAVSYIGFRPVRGIAR